MAVQSLKKSGIINFAKYRSMLAGNFSGDYELIETQILGSNAASVTFSNLGVYSSAYKHLQIRIAARSSDSAPGVGVYSRLNADAGSNYRAHYLLGNGSAVLNGGLNVGTTGLSGIISAGGSAANNFGVAVIDLLDPYSTTKNKTLRTLTGITDAAQNRIDLHSALWMSTASLTSWQLLPELGNFVTGSRFSLYGMKG
jgi:hypothetical protein